jgi:hypothetical protein
LLTRNPSERLGCGERGVQELKDHAFFAAVDWDAILKKKVPSPWIPAVCLKCDLQGVAKVRFGLKNGFISKATLNLLKTCFSRDKPAKMS